MIDSKNVSDLLWIIPGDKTSQNNLPDGKLITKTKEENLRQHIDIMSKFQKEYNLEEPSQFSYMGFAQEFCSLGMCTLINAGKIDGKYAAILFLPEQLTPSQIETLNTLRPTFEKEFYHTIELFAVNVYTTNTNLTYKAKNNNFRDLHIESIIEGKENKNGIELLYQEIEKQKDTIKLK
jgi:hypothetical protein